MQIQARRAANARAVGRGVALGRGRGRFGCTLPASRVLDAQRTPLHCEWACVVCRECATCLSRVAVAHVRKRVRGQARCTAVSRAVSRATRGRAAHALKLTRSVAGLPAARSRAARTAFSSSTTPTWCTVRCGAGRRVGVVPGLRTNSSMSVVPEVVVSGASACASITRSTSASDSSSTCASVIVSNAGAADF
jgi:hypothetical protein